MIAQCVGDFVAALTEDSFTQCFTTPKRISYNNTVFLYVCYTIGVLIRYCLLLPIRAAFFAINVVFFGVLIAAVQVLFPFKSKLKDQFLVKIFQWAAKGVCTSYGTIIRQHGDLPDDIHGCVYVANHTTTMDFAILSSIRPFSVIGQRHVGMQGFLQRTLCAPIDGVWFERGDRKDRQKTSRIIRDRVNNAETLCPLLIFPEGVCVNNRFIIQFKKGAFDLGVDVCPIAIKYSESSSAAYQNSRCMGFFGYLVSLWSQWALVVDIHYLPKTHARDGETAQDFAKRVQLQIARTAGLVPRNWDGYLKYVKISQKMRDEQKETYARQLGLIERLDDENSFSFSATQ